MTSKKKGQKPESQNPNLKSCNKDNQILTTYKAFNTETPKTMLQVSIETGIMRANICRYVAMFRKQGKIQLLHKGICSISKHRAGFYTTNKDLFENDNQLSLFL